VVALGFRLACRKLRRSLVGEARLEVCHLVSSLLLALGVDRAEDSLLQASEEDKNACAICCLACEVE
jgi:hypothetical protein